MSTPTPCPVTADRIAAEPCFTTRVTTKVTLDDAIAWLLGVETRIVRATVYVSDGDLPVSAVEGALAHWTSYTSTHLPPNGAAPFVKDPDIEDVMKGTFRVGDTIVSIGDALTFRLIGEDDLEIDDHIAQTGGIVARFYNGTTVVIRA